MSLILAPYGLAPVAHESGIVRPAFGSGGGQPFGGYTIASGYANNIFLNSPIQLDVTTAGGTSNLNLAANMAATAPGSITNAMKVLGTFQGVEFTLATGRRTVSNFWPAATVPFANSPTVAWITRDPRIRYQAQADGPIPATAMGNLIGMNTNGSANGNAITGFSTVSLASATLLTASVTTLNQYRIVGFAQQIDNNPADLFTQVIVEIALHQDLPIPGSAY